MELGLVVQTGSGAFETRWKIYGKERWDSKRKTKENKLEELSKDEQIEYLKMENAVLKKVKALRKNYGEH